MKWRQFRDGGLTVELSVLFTESCSSSSSNGVVELYVDFNYVQIGSYSPCFELLHCFIAGTNGAAAQKIVEDGNRVAICSTIALPMPRLPPVTKMTGIADFAPSVALTSANLI